VQSLADLLNAALDNSNTIASALTGLAACLALFRRCGALRRALLCLASAIEHTDATATKARVRDTSASLDKPSRRQISRTLAELNHTPPPPPMPRVTPRTRK